MEGCGRLSARQLRAMIQSRSKRVTRSTCRPTTTWVCIHRKYRAIFLTIALSFTNLFSREMGGHGGMGGMKSMTNMRSILDGGEGAEQMALVATYFAPI